jgi:hypothetical protein
LHGVGAATWRRQPSRYSYSEGWFEAPQTAGWAWTLSSRLSTASPEGNAADLPDVNGDGKKDVVYGATTITVFSGWRTSVENGKHTRSTMAGRRHTPLPGRPKSMENLMYYGKRYLAHDIVRSLRAMGLYWYRSAGDGSFAKHVIDYGSKVGGGMQIPVLDIDGDGDLDLVAPGKSGLFLFEQVNPLRQKGT